MLFGRSLFESVLVRMEEEKPPEEPVEEISPRIRGFRSGFVREAMEGVSVSLHRIDGAYRDFEGEEILSPPPEPATSEDVAAPADPGPPPLPAHLARLLPAEVAEDLGLTPQTGIEALQEMRRQFARENHPDVVHEAHREAANLRMTTANLLIDQAIARLQAARKLGLI